MKVSFQTIKKHIPDIDAGMNGKETVFYCHSDTGCEEFCETNHNGWYTNHNGETFKDGSGLARGIVVTLPKMPGFPDGRFLSGYYWGDNNERVIFPEMFKDESDAGRMADEHARVFAESAVEDSQRFDTMQNAEFDCETAQTACKLAIMARNVSPDHRQIAREAIGAYREAIDALETATRDYQR